MSKVEKILVSLIALTIALIVVLSAYVQKTDRAGTVDTFAASTLVRLGPADIYPTVPGSINPAITQQNIGQTICNPSWSTKSERPSSSYTTALKKKQLAQLNVKDTTLGDYEEDHLISLELGGNPTDPDNLWPERYTASVANGGAKTKDQVENYLKAQVCNGSLTLLEAQEQITNDWYLVYVDHLKAKYGSVNTFNDADPDDEQ